MTSTNIPFWEKQKVIPDFRFGITFVNYIEGFASVFACCKWLVTQAIPAAKTR
jgi:hypothetical protein